MDFYFEKYLIIWVVDTNCIYCWWCNDTNMFFVHDGQKNSLPIAHKLLIECFDRARFKVIKWVENFDSNFAYRPIKSQTHINSKQHCDNEMEKSESYIETCLK